MTGPGGGGPARYESPQAAFEAVKAAQKAKDFRTACDCFTPQSRNLLASYLTLTSLMMKNAAVSPLAGGPEREEDRSALEASCKALDDLLARHGLNQEKLQAIVTKDPVPPLEESIAAAAKFTAPIKNKPAFIVEIENLMHAIGVAYTGEESPDHGLSEARLENTKREDDRATAQVVVTYGGEEKRVPVGFKRLNGSWLIDLSDLAAVDREPAADEPVSVDAARGIMWTVKASAEEMSWGEAKAYVKELRYAGYEDWRLPTKTDLESLIDQKMLGRVGNDSSVTPLLAQFRTPRNGHLFSGTLVSSDRPDEPYIMNLRNGHIFNGKGYRGFVRAVRDAGPDDSKQPPTEESTDAGRAGGGR